MIYIAVTGHRMDKLGGHNSELRRRLVAYATSVIGFEIIRVKQQHAGEPVTFISGMASGWDQAVAEAVVKLGGGRQAADQNPNRSLGLCAAVPFVGQELRWPDEAQQHYRWLLERASESHVVHHGKLNGAEVFGAFHERNRWMVDHVSPVGGKLIALWNGSQGGTSHCVRYAQQKGVPVENVWVGWVELSGTMDATLRERTAPTQRRGL